MYPAEIKYSPPGLHERPLTDPLCPLTAPTSSQISSLSLLVGSVHLHRLHPPAQPQANASFPPCAQTVPTNPPNLCPPTSPNRWRFIHISFVPSSACVIAADGDHMMTDESVEADSRVGADFEFLAGRHDKHVTPASCPISNASRVTEKR